MRETLLRERRTRDAERSVGVVTQQQGVLTAPVSGLMGLGFDTLASSGATPFWQTLANENGVFDEPLMAFQFTRFLDVRAARDLEPGGTFTLGGVDKSLFTGDIDYQPIPDGQTGFWTQQISGALGARRMVASVCALTVV